MANAWLGVGGLLARGYFGYGSGHAAAISLLNTADPPTAIIASNDQLAMTTLEVCRERGIAISDDVSLVSLDSTPILRFTHTPLSAIDQPIADVAVRAMRLSSPSWRAKRHQRNLLSCQRNLSWVILWFAALVLNACRSAVHPQRANVDSPKSLDRVIGRIAYGKLTFNHDLIAGIPRVQKQRATASTPIHRGI